MKGNVKHEQIYADMEDSSTDAVNEALVTFLRGNPIVADRNNPKKDLPKKSESSKTLNNQRSKND